MSILELRDEPPEPEEPETAPEPTARPPSSGDKVARVAGFVVRAVWIVGMGAGVSMSLDAMELLDMARSAPQETSVMTGAIFFVVLPYTVCRGFQAVVESWLANRS